MKEKVKIFFPLECDEDGYPPVSVESVWAEVLSEGEYKILNTPFYIYDIAYEDVVSVKKTAEGYLEFSTLIKKSGRRTVRILILEKEKKQHLIDYLKSKNISWESTLEGVLFAVDCPPNKFRHFIKEMEDGLDQGWWEIQEGN